MPGKKQPSLHQSTSSIPLSLILCWEIELSSLTPLHETWWLAYYLMSCTEEEWAMHHCTHSCFHTNTLVNIHTYTYTDYTNTHWGTWRDNTFLSLSVVIVWWHITHTWMRIHTGAHTLQKKIWESQRHWSTKQCLCWCYAIKTSPLS